MSEAVISVHLPEPLLRDASLHADHAGQSIEHWVESVVRDRVQERYLTDKYFSHTPSPDDAAILRALLDKAPDAPPMPGDELED